MSFDPAKESPDSASSFIDLFVELSRTTDLFLFVVSFIYVRFCLKSSSFIAISYFLFIKGSTFVDQFGSSYRSALGLFYFNFTNSRRIELRIWF